MSREIEFRGKRIDNGEWIYGGYAENDGKAFISARTRYIPDTRDWDTVEYYENNPCYHLTMIDVDADTVGQYIGITDKNGKEIYEDDIVMSDDGKVGQVQWFEEHLAFMIWCVTDNKVYFAYDNDFSKIEVIGNVYENADFLKEETGNAS